MHIFTPKKFINAIIYPKPDIIFKYVSINEANRPQFIPRMGYMPC